MMDIIWMWLFKINKRQRRRRLLIRRVDFFFRIVTAYVTRMVAMLPNIIQNFKNPKLSSN